MNNSIPNVELVKPQLENNSLLPPSSEKRIAQEGVEKPSSLTNGTITNINGSTKEQDPKQIARFSERISCTSYGFTKVQPKTRRVFKVIIIGDANVGKTCLSFRFCNGRFPGPTESTIGVDFRERSLVIEDQLIKVQLWDTAGQERYRQSIVAHYYRNVNAVVFVYDVTNPLSFKSLPIWIDECKRHAIRPNVDLPHILVGNKCDLLNLSGNAVGTNQAQVFADENDMALFETSALADSESDNVESIFITLVHKLRQSKTMHVQSTEERNQKEQKLFLKAEEVRQLEAASDSCC